MYWNQNRNRGKNLRRHNDNESLQNFRNTTCKMSSFDI